MAILLALLFVALQAAADVISTTGNIFLDPNNNGASDAVITTTGLGIGTVTPSANLHVMGNAYVSGSLGLGTTNPSSTLGISGTLGFSVQSVSSNTTLSANTLVLANTSSGNITLTLPYAGNVLGRIYSIKKSNTSNTVTVSSSNLIDTETTWTLGSGNLGMMKVVSNGSQWYVLDSLYADDDVVFPTAYAVWLRADLGVTVVSGNVTLWEDQSGNNRNATPYPGVIDSWGNYANKPKLVNSALNGHPVIRFTQPSGFTLGDLSSAFPNAATLFVVATINNDGKYNLYTTGYVDTWWYVDEWGAGCYPAMFRTTRIEAYPIAATTSGNHVFAAESDSSTWEMWLDGVSGGARTALYTGGNEHRIGMPDNVLPLTTPWSEGAGGKFYHGDIAEIILYNRLLTSGEKNAVGYYLESRYNISTSYVP